MKEDVMARLLALIPDGSGMELPPKIFIDMEGEFVAFEEGVALSARFPNKEKYRNPVGFMQGGMITAAIDNTISPFSYTLGPANVTKEITTAFKRPIMTTDRYIEVTASVVEITPVAIRLKAEVRNEKGKVAAIATASCVYIKPRKQVAGC